MPTYQHYPMMMRHPAEAPAILGREHGEGRPARFPPVIVESPDQEEEYRAKGYIGGGDPQAFANAQMVKPDAYEPQEYPKWIGDRIVADEDEEADALEAMTAPEAEVTVSADPYASVEAIRETLIRRAEAKGIKVDGRWSIDRIIAELNDEAA